MATAKSGTFQDLLVFGNVNVLDYVKAQKFIGLIEKAEVAVQARQDALGQTIDATYIKNIKIEGNSLVFNKGDDSIIHRNIAATDTKPAITKLYTEEGLNEDGTMTQKAICDQVENDKLYCEYNDDTAQFILAYGSEVNA